MANKKIDFSLKDVFEGIEFLVRFAFNVLILKKMYAHRNTWSLQLEMEQVYPNDNSISLSEETDKFGQRVARLNWHVSDSDRQAINDVKDYLQQKGISEKKIHFELFTSSTPKKSKPKSQVEIDNSPKSSITIKVDGRSFDFNLSFNDDTSILDAALKQGADLPYACKGGMCCTCKAKLIEGEVIMDVHWGLDEEEIEQGYILTCQSHPKTEKVVVDFDVK